MARMTSRRSPLPSASHRQRSPTLITVQISCPLNYASGSWRPRKSSAIRAPTRPGGLCELVEPRPSGVLLSERTLVRVL
jgi:hypothetical protein